MDTLKRMWRRGKQAIMEKMGLAEKTEDPEFDALYSRYTDVVSRVTALTKGVQNLQNVYSQMMLHLSSTGESLSLIYDDGDRYKTAVERFWSDAVILDEASRQKIYDKLGSDVIQKLSEYAAESARIKTLLDARTSVLRDFDFRKTKFENTKDSDSEAKARRRIKLENNRREYEVAKDAAMEAMFDFIERREEVLDPVFDALVDVTRQVTAMTHQQMDDVLSCIRAAPMAGSSRRVSYREARAEAMAESSSPWSSSSSSSSTNFTAGNAGAAVSKFSEDQSFNSMHRNAAPPPPPPPPPKSGNQSLADAISEFGDEFYYLDNSNASKGPLTLSQLKNAFGSQVQLSTLVFGHGMKDWQPVSECARLRQFLSA